MMKINILYMLAAVIILAACNNDNDMVKADEASTNPYERIIGSWLLVKYNEEDQSSQGKVWTFMTDGTWFISDPTASPVTESDSQEEMEIRQVVSFEDGWTYNAEKDIISGHMDLISPSLASPFPYRFELKRKELMLSYRPRGEIYVMPPTPMVYYFKRK